MVSLFKPATLVLNSGLWRSKTDPVWPPEVFDAIFKAGRGAVAPQGGRAIWKTTTWAIDKRVPREWDDAALPYAAKHGWEVMDAFMLTQPAAMMQPPPYADDIHFLGQPYAGGWHGCGVAGRWGGGGERHLLCGDLPIPLTRAMPCCAAELNYYLLNMIC